MQLLFWAAWSGKTITSHVGQSLFCRGEWYRGLGIYVESKEKPLQPYWLNTSEVQTGFHETLMYFLVNLLRDLENIDLGVPDFFEWVNDK